MTHVRRVRSIESERSCAQCDYLSSLKMSPNACVHLCGSNNDAQSKQLCNGIKRPIESKLKHANETSRFLC